MLGPILCCISAYWAILGPMKAYTRAGPAGAYQALSWPYGEPRRPWPGLLQGIGYIGLFP